MKILKFDKNKAQKKINTYLISSSSKSERYKSSRRMVLGEGRHLGVCIAGTRGESGVLILNYKINNYLKFNIIHIYNIYIYIYIYIY